MLDKQRNYAILIDVYLEGHGARDEESKESLNIIFNNVVFDLGYIYNWDNIATFTLSMLNSYRDTLTSEYTSIESMVISEMEQTIASYKKLE